MTQARRRTVCWTDYGVAVGSVVLAGLLTLWLWPLMRPMPFAWLFAAVMLSGWRGGMGPGMCATMVAMGISLWLLFPSVAAVLAASPEDQLRLGVFLGIALTMTVLNGARHEAHAAQQRLAAIVESSEDAIISKSLDGVVMSWNAAAERLFGYRAAEMLGQPLLRLVPKERQTEEDVILARLRRGERVETFETVRQTKTGQCLEVAVTISPLRDERGQIVGASKIVRDITPRKRLEAALQHERHLWRVTLASIGDAVLVTDTAAVITFLNPVAERLTGWAHQEAVGRPLLEVFRIINEHTRQPAANPVDRVLRDGVMVGLANHTALLTREGREVPIADSGAPIRGQDGHIYGAVLVFRDVTEQHQAEAALRQAKEAAEAASRIKSEFLATMSHELRTPLNVILGYTDMLMEGAVGELPAPQVDILQRIDRNSRVLCELVSMVLDLNRLEAGRLPVDVQAIAVPDFLAEIKGEMQGLCDQSGLVCRWLIAPDVPVLHTDGGKLKVILKNLVSNALKFTKAGSMTLSAREQAGGIEFRVTDTGIGIPAEAQAFIFEPFRQLDGSDTRRYSGSGLGLHIVQRLVDVLGGQVTVESTVGQGSTFRVWLPTQPERGPR